MTNYKPYSSEWHRKRLLKEVADYYLNESADSMTIVGDLLSILREKSESCYADFRKINQLEYKLHSYFPDSK